MRKSQSLGSFVRNNPMSVHDNPICENDTPQNPFFQSLSQCMDFPPFRNLLEKYLFDYSDHDIFIFYCKLWQYIEFQLASQYQIRPSNAMIISLLQNIINDSHYRRKAFDYYYDFKEDKHDSVFKDTFRTIHEQKKLKHD